MSWLMLSFTYDTMLRVNMTSSPCCWRSSLTPRSLLPQSDGQRRSPKVGKIAVSWSLPGAPTSRRSQAKTSHIRSENNRVFCMLKNMYASTTRLTRLRLCPLRYAFDFNAASQAFQKHLQGEGVDLSDDDISPTVRAAAPLNRSEKSVQMLYLLV